MNIAIVVTGLSGIIAQVLLLRELLVSFQGNELTIGIILATWVICEACGVFVVGRLIDKVKSPSDIFVTLQLVFSLFLPIALILARDFKVFCRVPQGQSLSLPLIFLSSLSSLFLLSFCHGGLFSCCAKIYPGGKRNNFSIGKVYALETIGTLAGGVVFTYFLLPYLNAFQIVFILACLNMLISFYFFSAISRVLRAGLIFSSIILLVMPCGIINKLQVVSIKNNFKGGEVLGYKNSCFGNLLVFEKQGQRTFYYNGIPAITLPLADITFTQELVNIALLFQDHPKNLLLLNGGIGGMVNEILKNPVEAVDYAYLDPLIIEMLKKFPSKLTKEELSDARLRLINLDGRAFLGKRSGRLYDIILIGFSNPSDLSSNRFFSKEFFSLASERLSRKGVLVFWLPGSTAYLSRELKDLNASVYAALRNAFPHTRVIPGDYNIYFGSKSDEISRITPDLLIERMRTRNTSVPFFFKNYFDYRLQPALLKWFNHSMRQATTLVNSDLRPVALLYVLMLWTEKFSPFLSGILLFLQRINLKIMLVLIAGLILILFSAFHRRKRGINLAINYAIASTGFFGMLSTLVLIFLFQLSYGFLYYKIGLLMSFFMAGAACGAILIIKKIETDKRLMRIFIANEFALIIFPLILTGFSTKFADLSRQSVFLALFFLSGMLLGAEFPVAAKLYLKTNNRVGSTVGTLYFCDLLGACVGAILGSILFLPVLGVVNTCILIVLFKISSFILLLLNYKSYFDP